MKRTLLFVISLVLCVSAIAQDKRGYIVNRAPLISKPYTEIPLGQIKPEGWLKDQLVRMKNGMTGHLDSLYPEVMGPRNGWLGGDGDQWERGPYWIDGLMPLAYILDDQMLKNKVQPWIEWALASQQPSGYFGPTVDRPNEDGLQRGRTHDWWPKMVMLKVLQQYYQATGDERVIDFMTRYFKYQLETLPITPIDHYSWWGAQRGGDNLMVVYWLYNITGDKFLLALGDLIHKQSYDWTGTLLEGESLAKTFSMHTVNLAQGIKEPVIQYQRSGNPKHIEAVKRGFHDIKRYIGWPVGVYGGDEWLHGANPTQGAELCTVVELMFSLEKILEVTGDVEYADLLEKVAYNALPTQISDDFMTRQYFQQCNQVLVSDEFRNFRTHYEGTAQLFGLLTAFPCCTSNLHQGWPKLVQHLWLSTEDKGAAALVYAPSTVTMLVGGNTEVRIKEDTFYPFEEQVRFEVTVKNGRSVKFPLHLRIPSWCASATVQVNGRAVGSYKGGQIVKVEREWRSGDRVILDLPAKLSVSKWYEASTAIERGPLVYALKIGEDWREVHDSASARHKNHPHWQDFFEVYPTTPWNYALIEEHVKAENLEKNFQVVIKPASDKYPWTLENAPIEIKAKGRRIKRWTIYNGSAGPLPFSTQPRFEAGDVEDITLIPYGCTTLRITEFPLVK